LKYDHIDSISSVRLTSPVTDYEVLSQKQTKLVPCLIKSHKLFLHLKTGDSTQIICTRNY